MCQLTVINTSAKIVVGKTLFKPSLLFWTITYVLYIIYRFNISRFTKIYKKYHFPNSWNRDYFVVLIYLHHEFSKDRWCTCAGWRVNITFRIDSTKQLSSWKLSKRFYLKQLLSAYQSVWRFSKIHKRQYSRHSEDI